MECLDWRLVGSWFDGWVKGWESKAVGFGWSGPKLEPPMRLVEDLGFGGAALATKVVAPSTIRIWFGTLYGPTPLPAAY